MNRDDDTTTGWRSIYGDNGKDGANGPTDKRETAAATESGRLPALSRVASRAEGPAREAEPDDRSPAARTSRQEPNASTTSVPAVRRRKPKVLLWSFLIALCLVLAIAGGTLFYVWNGLRPTPASAPVKFTITSGMRASKVAELLEEQGLIRNAFLFGSWLKLEGEGSRFQAGEYELTPGMTREAIVDKLNKGDTIAAETIKFTIPEGFTVPQIAERLAEKAGADKEKFLEAASKPELWTGSVWTKDLPEKGNLRYPLEGYLFPETYEMKAGSTETEIVNRMLAELDRKLDQLPEDWLGVLEERGLTVHKLLTIASLVEREVVVDEERPIVASVIQNRLNKKMPLQIDATIQYLLDKQKERLLEADLKVDSPYNTYMNQGLPPGPIATPSLKSIEAALYPDQTDYLYYVTKKDGTNTHLFAETYNQHQKNIKLSEKNVAP
ncbi:endolytic transglycosylase MltG [Cohnella cellulosilytica]|uniref:Endolytic murein transglycosylase n=1 Tax=Cohnella cellulosilytica TaxID=986710 RepID=A0ABW2FAX3_9BACL